MITKQPWLANLKLFLLSAFILTLPLNLFYKFAVEEAYVNGLFVDYLLGKFYLFNFFSLTLLGIELFEFWQKKPELKFLLKNLSFFLLTLALIFRQFFTSQPLASFSYLAQLFLAAGIFYFLQRDHDLKSKLAEKFLSFSLMTSLALQSFLAYFQFFWQKNFLAYQFLGESNLNNFAGISHAFVFGREMILAYGSTAHPNILAGFAVLLSILLEQKSQNFILSTKRRVIFKLFLLINLIIILFFTQSITAIFTLIFYLLYKIIIARSKKRGLQNQKKISKRFLIISLILLFVLPFTLILLEQFFNSSSIVRRLWLNEAAWKIFLDNPLFGTGLNNFTVLLEHFSSNREVLRFIQPVHHSLLLVLAEGGFLYLCWWWKYLVKLNKSYLTGKIFILVMILAFDHYLLSQAAGINLLLLFLVFA